MTDGGSGSRWLPPTDRPGEPEPAPGTTYEVSRWIVPPAAAPEPVAPVGQTRVDWSTTTRTAEGYVVDGDGVVVEAPIKHDRGPCSCTDCRCKSNASLSGVCVLCKQGIHRSEVKRGSGKTYRGAVPKDEQ